MNQSDWQQAPFQPKPKSVRKTVSFVEALKNIGGQTVNTLKNDVVKGTLTDGVNFLVGNGRTPSNGGEQPPSWGNEWLPNRERDWQQEMIRRERHKEVTSINVFDRNQEELKAQIKALQDQLHALAKDMDQLSYGVASAIDQEITSPGTYHLNFLEKLKNLIIQLRIQVADSKNWLELSYQRKAAQNSYWAGFGKSGTKYSLSSERAIATSAG